MRPRCDLNLGRICRTPQILACSIVIEPSREAYYLQRLSARSREALQADDGSRTRDLRLGKPTLYQLSYVRDRGRFYGPAEPSAGRATPAARAVSAGSGRVRLVAFVVRILGLDRDERQQPHDLHEAPGMRRHVGAEPQLAAPGLGRPDQGGHGP
jgi:hypothetical protein